MESEDRRKLLKIYCGEAEKWQGKNLYHQIIMRLKQEGIAGVTIYRGIMGYGADKVVHSSKILELSVDLPVIIEVVDTEDKMNRVLPFIREMVPRGLLMLVDVQIISPL